MESLKSIRRLLRLFEVCSGLSVNLLKSKLYGFNLATSELETAAEILGCEADYGPITYLSLQVGRNHQAKEHLSGITEKN
ncbi:hypothetical protein ACS0TY_033867 [Phlomoides rotata]